MGSNNTTIEKDYSYLFLIPALLIFGMIFILPVLLSFFFSFTRWTLVEWELVGLENFITFFSESSLNIGIRNTILYAGLTSGFKVILGFLLGVLLCGSWKTRDYLRSIIFFPTILSTIAVGITFSTLMHPSKGIINMALQTLGISGPDWLGNPNLALFSVIFVDVWKGVGMATVIYIAGINAIPQEYYEALMIDGGTSFHKIRYITFPLSRPAMNSVILLSFIGGLRSFDLIWTMTKGGPGFATDLMASIIYKQYAAGFYGLATAGNVILFILITLLVVPLNRFLSKSEVSL